MAFYSFTSIFYTTCFKTLFILKIPSINDIINKPNDINIIHLKDINVDNQLIIASTATNKDNIDIEKNKAAKNFILIPPRPMLIKI